MGKVQGNIIEARFGISPIQMTLALSKKKLKNFLHWTDWNFPPLFEVVCREGFILAYPGSLVPSFGDSAPVSL